MKTSWPLWPILWAFGVVAFIGISALAAANETFPNDVWLARRIQDIDSAAAERALDWAEDVVDYPLIVLVCAVVASLLVLARDHVGAIIIAGAVPGRAVATEALKELVERPRPPAELLEFDSQPATFSFPSGHAGAAFVLFGLIFYFAALHIRDLRVRLPVQAVCVAIIAQAGLERVYVGHHWPSDVLGGYYVGALILGLLIAIHQFTLRRPSNLQTHCSFSRATTAREPE